VNLTTPIHLVRNLRMSGVTCLLPYTPSWQNYSLTFFTPEIMFIVQTHKQFVYVLPLITILQMIYSMTFMKALFLFKNIT
jgi:hypothetical protein